jgi:hypothetical protein
VSGITYLENFLLFERKTPHFCFFAFSFPWTSQELAGFSVLADFSESSENSEKSAKTEKKEKTYQKTDLEIFYCVVGVGVVCEICLDDTSAVSLYQAFA